MSDTYQGRKKSRFQALTSDIEVVTSGAIRPDYRTSKISIEDTVAYTLASGEYEGQAKRMICTVADGSPSGVITGVFLDGVTARTTITMNAVGDWVDLEWHGSSWFVVAQNSVSFG